MIKGEFRSYSLPIVATISNLRRVVSYIKICWPLKRILSGVTRRMLTEKPSIHSRPFVSLSTRTKDVPVPFAYENKESSLKEENNNSSGVYSTIETTFSCIVEG